MEQLQALWEMVIPHLFSFQCITLILNKLALSKLMQRQEMWVSNNLPSCSCGWLGLATLSPCYRPGYQYIPSSSQKQSCLHHSSPCARAVPALNIFSAPFFPWCQPNPSLSALASSQHFLLQITTLSFQSSAQGIQHHTCCAPHCSFPSVWSALKHS